MKTAPKIIFSLGTHPQLEKKIFKLLNFEIGQFEDRVFGNHEYYARIKSDVKNKICILLAVITEPVGEFMKLLVIVNAFKSNGAKKIAVVMPYFIYSRQDRVDKPGAPVTRDLAANLLASAGADRIITVDLHNPSGLGIIKKIINLSPLGSMPPAVKNYVDSSWTIAAPDHGAVKRARDLAAVLKIKKIIELTKARPRPGEARIVGITGAPAKDQKILIVDDMIDSGGTLIQAANFLKERGAMQIAAVCTHGIFSGAAADSINRSVIKKVFASESLPQCPKCSGKISYYPIDSLIAQGIKKHV
ncbi:MAG: ribose-phosphate diphosphokinase [Patescibacteria group bacterium]|nr:ribose-phosphate diphosphokinase [Patescibacteria group bacterium]